MQRRQTVVWLSQYVNIECVLKNCQPGPPHGVIWSCWICQSVSVRRLFHAAMSKNLPFTFWSHIWALSWYQNPRPWTAQWPSVCVTSHKTAAFRANYVKFTGARSILSAMTVYPGSLGFGNVWFMEDDACYLCSSCPSCLCLLSCVLADTFPGCSISHFSAMLL